MKKILVKGPALSQSGYGVQTRYALRSLRENEDKVEIFLENINWGRTGWTPEDNEERAWIDSLLGKTAFYRQQGGVFDVSIQVTIPNEWQNLAPINIGYTAGIETSKIAPEWIQPSNSMDKIIVCSQHGKHGFDNTSYSFKPTPESPEVQIGVQTPVDVVNYGRIDADKQEVDLSEVKTDFNFLSVCQWGPRKNLETTVTCFLEEFADDPEVGLIIKTSIAKSNVIDRSFTTDKLEKLKQAYPDSKCRVYLIHGNLSTGEMRGLYSHDKVHAMVSTTHGEGFGLPLFEASLEGLPILAPAWSGHVDFLYAPVVDKKTKKTKSKPMFTKIPFDLSKIQPQAVWPGVLVADSFWCFPKRTGVKSQMREVYKNYDAALSKAKTLKEHNMEVFTIHRFNREFFDALGLEFTEEEQTWNEEVELIDET